VWSPNGHLRQPLPRLQVALQHDLGGRGHLERHAETVDHLHPLAAQEAGEQVLVDVGGERGARDVADHRVAADGDRHRQPLAEPLRHRVVGGGVLVDLPVHPQGVVGVLLEPVEPEVAFAGLGVLGVGEPVVVEDAAVPRPHLQTGQPVEVDVRPPVDHLLAGRRPDLLRRQGLELHQLAQTLADAGPAHRQFGLDQLGDPVGDLGQRLDPERHRHPAFGAEQVDRHRHLTPGGALEQQRGTVRPDRPGHHLGDLQGRVHRHRHPAQFTRALQCVEERPEIVVREATNSHGR